MRVIYGVILFSLFVTSCSQKPSIINTGNPGQIKVIVFLDKNSNGKLDQGEPGLPEQVGISQDVSCPAGSTDKITIADTDSSGETVYTDLEPGIYCVMYMGSKGVTTKLTVDVYLSSDQEARVAFGITG